MYFKIFCSVLFLTTAMVYAQLPPQCVGVQCVMGICNITAAGAPFCQCFDGYKPSTIINYCIDIDECKVDNTLCGNNYCCNETGGFVCSVVPCQYRKNNYRNSNNNNLLWLMLSLGEAKK